MYRHFCILLLFNYAISHSQNCNSTFSGKVVDFHDSTPLIGAIIIINDSGKQIVTDKEGSFYITNLCNQPYTIRISHPLCSIKEMTIKVSGDTYKVLKLEHHIKELNEIIVYGNSFHEKSKTLMENKISAETLEKYSGETLGDALSSLSGVSSLNTGNSVVKPVVNGLHSSRVVIINNGIRMEDQEWGAEHSPNVDINSLGNITLIKGAGALQYSGSALGGVIVAEAPKVILNDSLYGKTLLRATTNGKGASFTSQLTKTKVNGLYSSAQLTLKRFGDFEAPNYVLSNTGILERNASFRIGFNHFKYNFELYYSIFKNEIGILRASHSTSSQDQIRSINSNVPLIINDFTYTISAPKQNVTHHMTRVKGLKRFKNLGKLSIQYDFQRNIRLEYDIRRGDDKNKPSTDLQLETHGIMIDLDSQIFNSLKFKTGIIGKYQNNFPDPNTGVRRIIPDYDKYDAGVYLITDLIINNELLLEAGGRFDYSYINAFKFYKTSFWESRNYQNLFPQIVVKKLDTQILTNPKLNFRNISATFGAKYSNEPYTLFLNYSFASRPPNPSELFSEGLHHSSARIELGDLRFKPEIGHKVALTFLFQKKNINVSVNPYINTINNFILIEPTQIQQTIRGNFQVWEYTQTNAQLLGLDMDVSFVFNKNFYIDNQFSFIKGTDIKKNEPLINIPPTNINNELVYQNYKLNNLKLALSSQYVFRQNRYPNNNFEIFVPISETRELVDVSTPPSSYQLLSFSSSIDLRVNKKHTLNLNFDIINLLNKSYRNYLNRLRYYSHELGRNLTMTIKYKF